MKGKTTYSNLRLGISMSLPYERVTVSTLDVVVLRTGTLAFT